jgi:hypothetical protein
LGRHESLLISGLFGVDLCALLGLLDFSALVTKRLDSSSFQCRSVPAIELGKFKNASGINPRLKIEEFSVTLDLDPERMIAV